MRVVNPKDYYHPQDRKALQELQQIPGFSAALKAFMKVFSENMIQGMNMSNKVRITDKQLPELYRLLPPLCETLGIDEPEFYLELNPVANAYTMGDSIISITVTSGLIELMDEKQLTAVIAHECGHIACRHVLYHTMADMVLGAGSAILGGNLITAGLQLAFFHWQRCSELSCDRAAAVCMDGYETVAEVMALLASGSAELAKRIDMELYMEQAEDYRNFMNDSGWNKMLQYYALMNQSHPFLSVRALEVREWCGSDSFKNIMEAQAGYPKRNLPRMRAGNKGRMGILQVLRTQTAGKGAIMRLFDEQTGYLRLDEIVQERQTFQKAMEDGKVTDTEMKEQAELVLTLLQELEDRLSDEDEKLVADALCELAVLYEMNAFREEQEG